MPSSISSSNAARRFVLAFAATLATATILFTGATEWLVRSHAVQLNPNYRYVELFHRARNTDAAFGDSHVMAGFVGVSGFVNLAMGGENAEAMAERVHIYFADKTPGRVVIQAGLHHFAPSFAAKARDVKASLESAEGVGLLMFREMHRYELLRYWDLILWDRGFNPSNEFQPDGARLSHRHYSSVPDVIRHQAARQDVVLGSPPSAPESTAVARTYRDLVRWLRQRGATICLVTMPVSPEHAEEAARIPSFRRARDFFTDLAREENATYVDLFDSGMDSHFFDDSTHLNAEGAHRISPIIASRCFG